MRRRGKLVLDDEMVKQLTAVSMRRTEGAGRVRRADIVLRYAAGETIAHIARVLRTNRPLVERGIDKALAFGPLHALDDVRRPGRPATIGDDARNWVVALACAKPTAHSHAQESWTYSLLIRHIREHCQRAGYAALAKLGKGRLNAILTHSNIQPHKVSYYVERRDPEFERKMAQVLCVYHEVAVQNASSQPPSMVTVSYDEKPGIQAIKLMGAELMPVPGQYPTRSRDYEYQRLGTVSLLAAIDLHNGRIFPLVRERHRSREFIEFLGLLDTHYPADWKIRVILDHHSAPISKETQAYLRGKPNRFEFVFTPKHGSWLNLVESFFSKLARSLLRHIRVASKEALVQRIEQGIAEINQDPVVFRWRYQPASTVIA